MLTLGADGSLTLALLAVGGRHGSLTCPLPPFQNPRFPCNLQMSDRQLDEAGESDVNNL